MSNHLVVPLAPGTVGALYRRIRAGAFPPAGSRHPYVMNKTMLALLLGLVFSTIRAVAAPEEASPASDDAELSALETKVRSVGRGNAPQAKASDGSPLSMGQQFIAAANEARAFGQQHPKHPKTAHIKVLEADALLTAELVGDHSERSRAAALVSEIRKDKKLSAKERIQIISRSDMVQTQAVGNDRPALDRAREASARALVSEFPDEPAGYEALLRQAENAIDSVKSKALADELLGSAAPSSIKVSARVLIERAKLLGQNVSSIVGGVLPKENAIAAARGRVLILYTWTSSSPGRMEEMRKLSQTAPANVAFAGVCVDMAESAPPSDLPGEQIHAEGGLAGPLAKALALSSSLPIYLADANGVLRDVSAERGDVLAKVKGISL